MIRGIQTLTPLVEKAHKSNHMCVCVAGRDPGFVPCSTQLPQWLGPWGFLRSESLLVPGSQAPPPSCLFP